MTCAVTFNELVAIGSKYSYEDFRVVHVLFQEIHRGYLLFCCEYHKYCHRVNENIMRAKHKWKFEYFHYTRWKFLWYSHKKSKCSFDFLVYTSMHVSDVITNITKQNINVMASSFSSYNVKCWRDKNKKFWQIKILIPKCSLHSI